MTAAFSAVSTSTYFFAGEADMNELQKHRASSVLKDWKETDTHKGRVKT